MHPHGSGTARTHERGETRKRKNGVGIDFIATELSEGGVVSWFYDPEKFFKNAIILKVRIGASVHYAADAF